MSVSQQCQGHTQAKGNPRCRRTQQGTHCHFHINQKAAHHHAAPHHVTRRVIVEEEDDYDDYYGEEYDQSYGDQSYGEYDDEYHLPVVAPRGRAPAAIPVVVPARGRAPAIPAVYSVPATPVLAPLVAAPKGKVQCCARIGKNRDGKRCSTMDAIYPIKKNSKGEILQAVCGKHAGQYAQYII